MVPRIVLPKAMPHAKTLLSEMRFVALKLENVLPRVQDVVKTGSYENIQTLNDLMLSWTTQILCAQVSLGRSISMLEEETSAKVEALMESRVMPSLERLRIGKLSQSILRRNLTAIFDEAPASTANLRNNKDRKLRQARMCEALRVAPPATLLAWSISFPFSLWTEMRQDLFYSVLQEMNSVITFESLPVAVSHAACRLSTEEPLCKNSSYCIFTECKN